MPSHIKIIACDTDVMPIVQTNNPEQQQNGEIDVSQAEEVLTKKQILISRIVLGAAVVLLGVFLLLCGLDVVKVRLIKVIIPAVLITAGLVCFVWGIVQDNTLMLWLCFPLVFSGIVSVLVLATDFGYGCYYPIYIVSPAIASFVTALFGGEWRDHIKVIIGFGISAAIFSLNSIFSIALGIVIPVFVLFAGVAITVYSVLKRK